MKNSANHLDEPRDHEGAVRAILRRMAVLKREHPFRAGRVAKKLDIFPEALVRRMSSSYWLSSREIRLLRRIGKAAHMSPLNIRRFLPSKLEVLHEIALCEVRIFERLLREKVIHPTCSKRQIINAKKALKSGFPLPQPSPSGATDKIQITNFDTKRRIDEQHKKMVPQN